MTAKRRLTILRKLIIGFGAVGLLVVALVMLGVHVVGDASTRLESTLDSQVRPLADLNRLQTRINRIRVLEIELPRLADYFAVAAALTQLRSETLTFAEELAQRSARLRRNDELAARQLEASWTSYRDDLVKIVDRADSMKMQEVEQISTFESAAHFRLLSDQLRRLAEDTEASAGQGFERALAEHDKQRQLFLTLSVAGLLVIATLVVALGRSLSARLSALGRAAQSITDGRSDQPIDASGSDELADLAAAFNRMQGEVKAREHSLRVAFDEMEDRVRERTQELHASNQQLRQEVDERKLAESRLRLLSQAIEDSPAGVMIVALAGRIEYANATMLKMSGLAPGQLNQRLPQIVCGESASAKDLDEVWAAVRANGASERQVKSWRDDGSAFWQNVRVSPVVAAAGGISHYLVACEDITVRREQEQKILYHAQYDGLTGLPNRLLAMDRLGQTIASAARNGDQVVLMFIDLDDFKKINDSLGHQAGDALLIEAASRLRATTRADDTVARQGGDEFLVIMGGLRSTAAAEMLATKIIGAFVAPFRIDHHELFVTPSIGIAVFPHDGEDASTLLRNADLAMYEAKDAGRNTFLFFNQDVHDKSVRRLAIERRLRGALAHNELRLVYQPLVDLASGRVIGAEALLRWASPDFGLLAPDSFIHIAEQTGMIVDIGDWVLDTAARQLALWRTRGGEGMHIAVNVSPRQFRGQRLIQTIADCLQRNELPSGTLQIEVTEGLLIRNSSEVLEILRALERLGVLIALDDFGTGYSSLSYLRRYPFDTLKIDREFVRDLADDSDDRTLVAAAIQMGKSLGLNVVAEGVETADQMRILTDLGCDTIQGYLISKPVDAAEFAAHWLPAPP